MSILSLQCTQIFKTIFLLFLPRDHAFFILFIYILAALSGMQDLHSLTGDWTLATVVRPQSPHDWMDGDSSKILLYGHLGTAWSLEFLPNSSEVPFVYPMLSICATTPAKHCISYQLHIAPIRGVLLSPGTDSDWGFRMFKCLPKLYYHTVWE